MRILSIVIMIFTLGITFGQECSMASTKWEDLKVENKYQELTIDSTCKKISPSPWKAGDILTQTNDDGYVVARYRALTDGP